MGRHNLIESTVLHELTSHEERSQRAFEMIEYQHATILHLEKELQEQRRAFEDLREKEQEAELQDYEIVQSEISQLRSALLDLKVTQKTIRVMTEQQQSKIEQKTKPIHLESVATNTDSMTKDAYSETTPIRNETEENLITSRICKLEQTLAEISKHLDDMTLWHRKVEGVLTDMKLGVDEDQPCDDPDCCGCNETGDSGSLYSRQLWRTARKFFTPEESHFLLSATRQDIFSSVRHCILKN